MIFALVLLGLASLFAAMFICVEIEDDTTAKWFSIGTAFLGVIFIITAIIGDEILTNNFRERELQECKDAGGDYVVITAGNQPDLCVTAKNFILPQGWFNEPW